jgi:hypothetical protein
MLRIRASEMPGIWPYLSAAPRPKGFRFSEEDETDPPSGWSKDSLRPWLIHLTYPDEALRPRSPFGPASR